MLKKKIELALGGGGARGICHIEFLKVLDEMLRKATFKEFGDNLKEITKGN